MACILKLRSSSPLYIKIKTILSEIGFVEKLGYDNFKGDPDPNYRLEYVVINCASVGDPDLMASGFNLTNIDDYGDDVYVTLKADSIDIDMLKNIIYKNKLTVVKGIIKKREEITYDTPRYKGIEIKESVEYDLSYCKFHHYHFIFPISKYRDVGKILKEYKDIITTIETNRITGINTWEQKVVEKINSLIS